MQFLNSLMVNGTKFLGAMWGESVEEKWATVPSNLKFLKSVCENIYNILWPVLVIVSTVGCIWAIWLGIKMAKADEASKREEARKNVINTVVAMAVVIILILTIQLIIIPNLGTWIS